MGKDAEHSARIATSAKPAKGRQFGGGLTFLGILIGLILGLALAVAWYRDTNKLHLPGPGIPQIATKAEAAPPENALRPHTAVTPAPKQAPPSEKVESTTLPKEKFYVQVGAFQKASDAEARQVRLAMLGLQAIIQPRHIPDKGVWYRVRVGPFSTVDEVNQAYRVLQQNGFGGPLMCPAVGLC